MSAAQGKLRSGCCSVKVRSWMHDQPGKGSTRTAALHEVKADPHGELLLYDTPRYRNHLKSGSIGIFFCSTMHLDWDKLRCCVVSRFVDTDKAITS